MQPRRGPPPPTSPPARCELTWPRGNTPIESPRTKGNTRTKVAQLDPHELERVTQCVFSRTRSLASPSLSPTEEQTSSFSGRLGHAGLAGNEAADQLAGCVAAGDQSRLRRPRRRPRCCCLPSSAAGEAQGGRDPPAPVTDTGHDDLTRWEAVTISQLRTGASPLTRHPTPFGPRQQGQLPHLRRTGPRHASAARLPGL